MAMMKFRVHSLRIEKTKTYNDRENIYEDNKIYILNCVCGSSNSIKFEIRLWEIYGDCYSGWCEASYGYVTIQQVDSFIGMTHKPIKELEFELEYDFKTHEIKIPDTIENDIFRFSYDGGDEYYADGYAEVNEELFESINRNKEKRPVWIFKGDSALGKSYLAGIISNSGRLKSVYETDAHEKLDSIHEDIIVIGNKYNYSVEDVEKYIDGEHESILVEFSKLN